MVPGQLGLLDHILDVLESATGRGNCHERTSMSPKPFQPFAAGNRALISNSVSLAWRSGPHYGIRRVALACPRVD